MGSKRPVTAPQLRQAILHSMRHHPECACIPQVSIMPHMPRGKEPNWDAVPIGVSSRITPEAKLILDAILTEHQVQYELVPG